MSEQALGAFLKSLDENEALRKKFSAAVAEEARSATDVVAFAKQNGFDFTEEDLEKVSKSVAGPQEGALSDNELEGVAGGVFGSYAYGSYSTTLLKSVYSYNFSKVFE